MPLICLGNIPLRRCWVFHSSCTCDVDTTSLQRPVAGWVIPAVLKLDSQHYFLFCYLYYWNRVILMNDLKNIPISFSTVSNNNLISWLLYGDDKFHDTKNNKILAFLLPQVTGEPNNLEQSCDTTIVSFVFRFFQLPWCSINKVSSYFVIIVLLCYMTSNQYSFQKMKLNISMTSWRTFGTCLVMLCFIVYFLDYLWMTSILFYVNIYRRFFSISKLVNWIISDHLVHKGLENQNFSRSS